MKARRDGEAAQDRKTSLAEQDLSPRDHTPSESCRAGPFREGTSAPKRHNSDGGKSGKAEVFLSFLFRLVASACMGIERCGPASPPSRPMKSGKAAHHKSLTTLEGTPRG